MNWIDQYENEQKAENIAKEKARAERAAHDKAAQSWIGALLESRLRHSVEQVNQRLGRDFHLGPPQIGYGFQVYERRLQERPPHLDWFEVSCYIKDANTIHLSGNKGWDPQAMPESWDGSANDWTGKAWSLEVLPRGPQLLGDEDIDALFKWLVVETSSAPQLTLEDAMARRQQEVSSAKLEAYVGLTCGILGFLGLWFLFILGPIALWLGIRANRRLEGVSEASGARNCARWAIGLGGFVSLVLAIAVFFFLRGALTR